MNVALIIHEATIIAEIFDAMEVRGRLIPTVEELERMRASSRAIRRETAAGRKKGGRS